MRLFSEGGISQQKMVRDFPVALNIAERVVNTIENEIEEGRLNMSAFATSDPDGVDITQMVLENQAVLEALKNFSGQEMGKSTKFIPNFKAKLLVRNWKDSSGSENPDVADIRLNFFWVDRNSGGNTPKHKIILCLLKNKK